MNPKIVSFFAFLLVFTSCQFKSNNYDALEQERDSLAREKAALQKEMEEYFKTINQIELNIEKIKNAEKLISMQPLDAESSLDTRNKINDDLAFINEMLKVNREEINKLKNRLQRSSFKSAELERSLLRLSKSLEEETYKVQILEARILEKDSIIGQLSDTVSTLSGNVQALELKNEEQTALINEQQETIHSAWYVFGTRRELREQKIITSDGLFRPTRILESDFNKSYFVRIDARQINSIPLFSSRAKILSSHPRASYTLEKENNVFTLLINDPEHFWSISKYLVIEVD